MNWQPIETAPKDGTRIDLWASGKRWADAYYARADDIIDWDRWEVRGLRTTHLPVNPKHHEAPTHWMPLPQPPSR